MAQSFSSTIGSSALSNALNKKINPAPLQFSVLPQKQPPAGTPQTQTTSTPQYANFAPPSSLNAAYGATKGPLTGYTTGTIPSPTLAPIAPAKTTPAQTSSNTSGLMYSQTGTSNNQGGTQNTQTGNGLYSQIPQFIGVPSGAGRPATADELAATYGYSKTPTYPGIVNTLASSGDRNTELGNNAQKIGNDLGKEIADTKIKFGNMITGDMSTGTSPVAEGNAGLAYSNMTNRISALSEQAQQQLAGNAQALTGQVQTQSALNNAGNLSAPVTQFGQLTSPLTGDVVGGGTTGTNPQLSNAVNQAVELVKNGADPQSSQVQALISPFSVNGQQAFTQAMQQVTNGTYNPTAQSAIAGQNAAQGAKYQQAATDLDTSLKQLDTVTSISDNFGKLVQQLNPSDNQILNKNINTYIGTVTNPTALLQYNMLMGDINKFQSSILAADNGQIPTAVTDRLKTFDPSNLSVNQLHDYLGFLNELGKNQLSVIQGQSTNSYGGQSGYAGTPTPINTSVTPPANATTQGITPANTAKAGGGFLINLWGGIENLIGSVAHSVAGGVAAGEGVASYLFGI